MIVRPIRPVVVTRIVVVGVDLSAVNAVVVRVNPYLNSTDGLILEMSVLYPI